MPVTSFLKQYIKSKSHALVETSSAYSDFLLCKKSVIRSTVSPLRKKYHSVQLLVCKRTRNAELSLTTFCGFWISLRKKSVARSAVLPLRKKSRSAQLFAYKCAHDAELSLPTFCGYWCVFSMFVEWEIITYAVL